MSATMAPAPQHMRALELANQVRLARADLKRRVGDGDLLAADIILSCPPEARTMPVTDLLLSQRRWGVARCRKLLASVPVIETKQIGKMTERQRRALAQLLGSPPDTGPHSAGIDPPPTTGPGYGGFARA